jgi:hypothetical protein
VANLYLFFFFAPHNAGRLANWPPDQLPYEGFDLDQATLKE